MHPNRRVVPLYYVLQRVARPDSQGLANLSWNGGLPLIRDRGMSHRSILTKSEPAYVLITPYFTLAGNCGRTSPGAIEEIRIHVPGRAGEVTDRLLALILAVTIGLSERSQNLRG